MRNRIEAAVVSVNLYSLPGAVTSRALIGKSAVAVDVLRASTTIATALSSGASSVIPVRQIEQARQLASETGDVLLGGERKGVLIEGFDLSNSPQSYAPELVADRNIVFTSTNGTRAIDTCRPAEEVLVGSFVNLATVCDHLQRSSRSVVIVCAGTDGHPTLEDTLFGGAVIHQLGQFRKIRMNPDAKAASELWKTALRQMDAGKSLSRILLQTQGGKNLVRLGMSSDIEFAAHVNRFDFVPVLDSEKRTIRADVDPTGQQG